LPPTIAGQNIAEEWNARQKEILALVTKTYDWAIGQGIAKEQARAILPEGNTVSRLYMNGTLRSWIHFIELRSANGTQKEHQMVALECAKVIAEVFPLAKDIVNK
jgi:thymidylate synthase (FAD)